MQIPIRILVTDVVLPDGVTWGEVITNWEAYQQEWQEESILPVGLDEAPLLDMYEDATLSIKEVVKDLKDPAKLFTDFSRSFTLPASRKNNRIFKHYYNLDIDNGFDARSLVPCKLLMNNEVYKVGNIQLESVKMRDGKAESYNVRFFGKLSELGKKLGEDRLHSLSLAAISNFSAYTKFAQTSKADIVFPLSSRENRFKWNSNKTAYDAVDKTKTIQYIDSTRNPSNYGIEPPDLVGAMKVDYLISRIEADYGLSFTGAIKQNYIAEMYLWLSNYVEDDEDNATYDALVQNLTPLTTNFNGLFVDATNHWFQFLNGTTYEVKFRGTWTGNGSATILNQGAVVATSTTSGQDAVFTVNGTPTILEYQITTASAQTVNTTVQIKNNTGGATETFTGSVVVNSTETYFPKRYIPDLTINEFLGAIFKMFNIIAIVQDNLTINTYHYDSFMAQGEVKDISKYFDTSAYTVAPPNFYNAIDFKHEQGDTAIEEGYFAVNGKQYGDLYYCVSDEGANRVAGKPYELETGITVIPVEPVTDKVVHTYFGDTSLDKVKVKASFTYVMPSFTNVAFDNGTSVLSVVNYLQPTNIHNTLHTNNPVSLGNGLFFGSELYIYDPSVNIQGLGLYNSFYRGLVGSLLDEDKRVVKGRAMLSQGFLKDLKLSDVLTVRGNFYNISSIETNFTTGISSLELIQIGRQRLPNWSVRAASATNNTGATVYVTYINDSGYITTVSVANTGSLNINTIGEVLRDTGSLTWSYS